MTLSALLGILTAVALLALALLLWRARSEIRQLRQGLERSAENLQNLQLSFSRFAPDDVIERVIADGEASIGEKKDVTVLFADLVGFTALSQRVEPPVLVQILNGYFERMSQAISAHRGYVSTFLGDGILALFGALRPNPWQANDAVHAALEMRSALRAYSDELKSQGLPEHSIGVGLQNGTGVAGLVGSLDLKEFTVIGRMVNEAARVQELTRQFPADIIVTKSMREAMDPGFELVALPATMVKGVDRPLEIFGVEAYRGTQSE